MHDDIPTRPGQSRASGGSARRRPREHNWWALSCTSLGMLLTATNSGTLIIALPDLERSLHAACWRSSR